PGPGASLADRELALDDVDEMIARVTVTLDHDVRIIAAEDDHPPRVPLEELLVHRDPPLAVLLRDDLRPRDVRGVDEGEPRGARRAGRVAAPGPVPEPVERDGVADGTPGGRPVAADRPTERHHGDRRDAPRESEDPAGGP